MDLKDLKELLELEEEKDTIDLRKIFDRFISNWILFAISVFTCLFIAGVYTLTITPEFRVSAGILIKEKNSNPLKGSSSFLDNMDLMGGKDNVLDEMQVINSKTLMLRAIKELDLQTSYFKKSTFKKIELYKNNPFIVSMQTADLDTLAASFEIQLTFDKSEIEISGVSKRGLFKNIHFKKTVTTLPTTIETKSGLITISYNSKFPKPKGKFEAIIRNPLDAASILKESCNIELADKKANVITISYTTKNKLKGKTVISKLIEIYNAASVDEKNRTAYNTINFINDRLGFITSELTSVEKNVENYKKANKLTDIKAESEEFIKQNSAFEKQRLDIETQINLVDFVNQYIHKEENKYGVVPNIGIQDENLANVLKGYNELIFRRDRLIRTTTETNPIIIDLERQIKAMRKSIEASVESTKRGLLISKKDMDRQDQTLTSRIKNVPRQEREFIEIKRQQEIKAALYTYLLQKREENSLTLAIGIPSARIIEEPLAEDKPVSKGAGFYLAIAFILGFVLPVIFLFLKVHLKGVITNRAELENLTKVTILGELPEYKGKESIVVKSGSNEPIAEMYRLIRANLQFILHDKSKKVINVTSSESGEGKTTFSLNLAMTLALTGKKTIVVGLDIRKPSILQHINLPKTSGITAYLSGIESDYKKIIQQTQLNENLFVLQSGTVPPNPNELLLKDILDELFEDLRKEFDYIIVDTAPVGMVSDTYLLDRLADVNLFVFRANYSHRYNTNLINDIAKKNKLKNLYIVLKGSDISPKPYGYSKNNYKVI